MTIKERFKTVNETQCVNLEAVLLGSRLSKEAFLECIEYSVENKILIEIDEKESVDTLFDNAELVTQYFSEIENSEDLDPKEFYRLCHKKVLEAEELESLMAQFLVIPAKIALHYHSFDYLFLDLVQEGNIGLLEGLSLYDAEQGFDITYFLELFAGKAILDFIDEKKAEERAFGEMETEYKTLVSRKESLEAEEKSRLEKIVQMVAKVEVNTTIHNGDLAKALATLNETEQTIIEGMLGFAGITKTVTELSSELNMTEENVNRAYRSALEILKKYLLEHGDLNAIEEIFN